MEIGHVLPEVLAESELWRYVFDIADALVHLPVGNRIDAVANRYNLDWIAPSSRLTIDAADIDEDTAKVEMIKKFAEYVGYHYSNVQNDANAFLRCVSEAPRLGPDNGNSKSFNFVQFILNGHMEFVRLYHDPVGDTLVPENHPSIFGRRIVLDGETVIQDCYPTPYLSIKVQQGTGLTTEALLGLLYSVLPENLVIHNLETVFVAPTVMASETILGPTDVDEQSAVEITY